MNKKAIVALLSAGLAAAAALGVRAIAKADGNPASLTVNQPGGGILYGRVTTYPSVARVNFMINVGYAPGNAQLGVTSVNLAAGNVFFDRVRVLCMHTGWTPQSPSWRGPYTAAGGASGQGTWCSFTDPNDASNAGVAEAWYAHRCAWWETSPVAAGQNGSGYCTTTL